MEGNITINFTWKEMTVSRTSEAHSIANQPGTTEIGAIEHLVKTLLQPLRDIYGRPIRISSGYRSAELNRLVGGTTLSQHLKGEAADCVAANVKELLDVLVKSGLPFDQAILYRKRNFLHLSLKTRGMNRKQVIIK